jgi:thermitase
MKPFLLAFLSCIIINNVTSQNIYKDYQDGIVIFQLKTDKSIALIPSENGYVEFTSIPFLNRMDNKYDFEKVTHLYPNHPNNLLERTYQINFFNPSEIDQFIKDLATFSEIEYAEKKELHHTTLTPNDTYFSNSTTNGQWALFQIEAQQAWDISTGSAGTIVAVTDNAINVNHPDLTNKMLQGYDAVDNDNDPTPCGTNDGFHGSHVSGIVGAETNNNLGISSIGYDVSILPVKIGDCNGSLTGGYEGITWAADNGADVINMSWGGGGSSTYGQNVCNYAWNQGAILIAAAGNDGVNSVFYPAGYTN